MNGTGTPRNLVGYYAIPAQYILDLINYKGARYPDRVGVYGADVRIIEFNENVFYNAYERLASQYNKYLIPYVCGSAGKGNLDYDLEDVKLDPSSNLSRSIFIKNSNIMSLDSTAMKIATIGVKSGNKTVVNKFLNGSFDSYYCATKPPNPFEKSFPAAKNLNANVWSAIESISSAPFDMISWYYYYAALAEL
jgi:hypothetical protein